MQYTVLGRTGISVSVAGLGCGGSSRLGLSAGHSIDHGVNLIRQALDRGVNLIDTAYSYDTEPVVGAALKAHGREGVIVSTKQKVVNKGGRVRPDELIQALEKSLKSLNTDYVDIFYLHTVLIEDYSYAKNELVPVLQKAQRQGKFRFLGITEMPPRDAGHQMLQSALHDDCWDVMMFAFHMLNQNARQLLFPLMKQKNIGAVLMFAVRSLFSESGRLEKEIKQLVRQARVPAFLADEAQPLDFLIHEQGASNLIEAAYRYARHESGVHTVLFGTGNSDHLQLNIDAILKPILPLLDRQRVEDWFSGLEGVGLDEPQREKVMGVIK